VWRSLGPAFRLVNDVFPRHHRIWPGKYCIGPQRGNRAGSLWFTLRLSRPWREAYSLCQRANIVFECFACFAGIQLDMAKPPFRGPAGTGFFLVSNPWPDSLGLRHESVPVQKIFSTLFTIRPHLSNPLCYLKAKNATQTAPISTKIQVSPMKISEILIPCSSVVTNS
jgi:hypothetical protein